MDMNLGDTFTIPLGYSSPIVLGELLDPEDIEGLKINGDGSYSIYMDDSIDVDLSAISDIDVKVDAIDETLSIEPVSLDVPTLDPFEIKEDTYDITFEPTQLDVEIGTQSLDNSANLTPDIANISNATAGHTISDVELPISIDDNDNATKSIKVEFTIPEEVDEVSYITFNDTATITLDASNLKTRFSEDFTLSLEYVKITFPEGFYLDGTQSNVVLRESLEVDANGKIIFDFTINSYNKVLSGDDSLIEGDITFDVAENIVIGGTTSGVTPDSDALTLSISGSIGMDDMSLVLSSIQVPIGDGDDSDEPMALGSTVSIDGIDEMITGISSITLDEDGDQINISISALEGFPSTLSVGQSDNLTLEFPSTKFAFDIKTNSDAGIDITAPTVTGGNYELNIPLSAIIGGSGYNKNLTVSQILFEPGDFSNQTLTFDPEIVMSPTQVNITGSILLSAYETFSSTPRSIEASISAEKDNEQQLEVASAAITTSGYTAVMSTQTSNINESVDVDSAIENIYSLEFAGDDVYLSINIDVDISGTDAALSFKDYVIEFPLFIKFAPEVGATLNEAGDKYQITLSDTFTQSGNTRSYRGSFKVDELDFTHESYSGIITPVDEDTSTLSISGEVSLSGDLYLAGGDVDSGSLPETITPQVSYSLMSQSTESIEVGKVYGIFSTELSDEDNEVEPIDLSDFVSEIEGGNLSLVLSNPSILLTAKNTLDIPLEITSFILSPTRDGEATSRTDENGNQVDIVIKLDEVIRIEPAADGETTTTTICITNDGADGGDANINYVAMSGFNYLLAELPDQIEISYTAGIATDQTHMIDLAREEDYTFSLDYKLDIPLEFESFELDYSTVVDGLSGDLEEVLGYVSSLFIEIEATSDMPFNVEITEITPLDIEGAPITGLDPFIESGKGVIKANGTSTLELEIADNESGDLSRLDGLELSIEAYIDSSVGGSLVDTQSITLKFTAGISGGINISGDDL